MQLPPKPNVELSWDRSATWHGESTSQEPELGLLALPRAAGCVCSQLCPALTVAVGEVEVALGTGLAVLPGVVGFAVAAPGQVLAGAVGEVRLTVTACREGQVALSKPQTAYSSKTSQPSPAQCHPGQQEVTAEQVTLTVANVRRVDGVVGGSIVARDAPLTVNASGVVLKDSGLERHQFLCLQDSH